MRTGAAGAGPGAMEQLAGGSSQAAPSKHTLQKGGSGCAATSSWLADPPTAAAVSR